MVPAIVSLMAWTWTGGTAGLRRFPTTKTSPASRYTRFRRYPARTGKGVRKWSPHQKFLGKCTVDHDRGMNEFFSLVGVLSEDNLSHFT